MSKPPISTPAGMLNKQFGVGGGDGFKELSPGVFHSPVGFSPQELQAKTQELMTNGSIDLVGKLDPRLKAVVNDYLSRNGHEKSPLAKAMMKGKLTLAGNLLKATLAGGQLAYSMGGKEKAKQADIDALIAALGPYETAKGQEALHQQFYRSTFKDTVSALGLSPSDPKVRQAQRNYQTMVRTAQRFVIKNAALEEVYFLSQNVNKLYERTPLALIPFDTVWIEYDCHERVRLSREYGTAMDHDGDPNDFTGVPRRSGFLLKQLYADRADAWIAFKIIDSDAAGLIPVGMIFDAQSEAQMEGKVAGWQTLWSRLSLDLLQKVGMANVVDHEKMQSFAWGIFNNDMPSAPYLANMSAYAVEPLWGSIFDARTKGSDPQSLDVMAQLLVEAVREHSGDMRFLVTLLAFMNEVPILLNTVEPKGSFTAGGKMQSFFTHRTVEVNIPAKHRKQRRSQIAKIMAKAVKNHKRAHRVRAHVRRYYKGGLLYKQSAVKAHVRGNAALGWVHQDYEVTAK